MINTKVTDLTKVCFNFSLKTNIIKKQIRKIDKYGANIIDIINVKEQLLLLEEIKEKLIKALDNINLKEIGAIEDTYAK